jgi:hypothetical protein
MMVAIMAILLTGERTFPRSKTDNVTAIIGKAPPIGATTDMTHKEYPLKRKIIPRKAIPPTARLAIR